MDLLEKIIDNKELISVVGLGYVGLPLAVAFGKKKHIIGFDINKHKIENYINHYDETNEVDEENLMQANIYFTSNPQDLRKAKFHIVAVPTPIDRNCRPDLTPVTSATTLVGQNLVKGSIVVYESTVYPGVTEEICIPILERESGLQCGEDFFVGYSPERINPGDKEHTVNKIVKVVAGQNSEVLDIVAGVYEIAIDAGVYKAPSIKVAEAAKVIENTQRDLNIALMNELAIIFDKLGINTHDVLAAAGTKWNFLKFVPGLVGGHCIGVDPYYLTYKAEEIGYHPEVILAGRRINDSMGKYVAEKTVKLLIRAGKKISDAQVLILGATFKEDVPDFRNSKVFDVINELRDYAINVYIDDPYINEHVDTCGAQVASFKNIKQIDAIILAVPHKQFLNIDFSNISEKFTGTPIIIDIKGTLHIKQETSNLIYWNL